MLSIALSLEKPALFFLSMSIKMVTMRRDRDTRDMTTAMTSPMTRPVLMLKGKGEVDLVTMLG